eukprot:6193379-Pleurochrysis_carterae.AAC.2
MWVPSAGRILVTLDVHFDELLLPWRDTTKPTNSIAQHADGDLEKSPGLLTPSETAADAALLAPRKLRGTFTNEAFTARRVLLLFSGHFSRSDVISAFLSRYAILTDCVDNDNMDGGGQTHNILLDLVYERLLLRCTDGYYATVVVSPPCSTFQYHDCSTAMTHTTAGLHPSAIETT